MVHIPFASSLVLGLAATNFRISAEDENSPEKSARTLDPALVRRFSRSILVDLPDTAARKQYFQMRLSEARNVELSASVLDLLAEKSAGMSIANLEQVIETAARAAVQKNLPMNGEMVLEALDTTREGEAKKWSPEFLESTARHEAGHTIMYWLSGWWAPEVSIIARGDHGGGMRRSEEEMKRESLNKEDILARIRTLLGGRAAEVLCYGPERGLTTGASGDLEHATGIVRQMVCAYGMETEFGLAALPEVLRSPVGLASPLFAQINARVNQILQEQMERTLKLLGENRKHLDSLTTALLQKNRLYRGDLQELLPKVGRS